LQATLGRAWENIIGAGTLGLYQLPIEATSPYGHDLLTPVSMDSVLNLIGAVMYGAKSEADFVQQLKNAGLDFAEKEVALWRQAYRRYFGEGKTHRQLFPLEKKKGAGLNDRQVRLMAYLTGAKR
jgi:hypothetical protein